MNQESKINISVLGFKEGSEWTALALEMDIRGHGGTFQEALEDLDDLIAMQVSFAQEKGQIEMILRPAEPMYFQMFAQAREEELRNLVEMRRPEESDYKVTGLNIPPAHVIDSMRGKFVQSYA